MLLARGFDGGHWWFEFGLGELLDIALLAGGRSATLKRPNRPVLSTDMGSGTQVPRRISLTIIWLAAAAAISLAIPSGKAQATATVVGQVAPAGTDVSDPDSGETMTVVDAGPGSGGPSYIIPSSGGTITSWQVNAPPGSDATVKLALFQQSTGSNGFNRYQVVAETGWVKPTGGIASFATSLIAPPRAVLGLIESGMAPAYAGTGVVCGWRDDSGDALSGQTFSVQPGDCVGGDQVNLQATLQPGTSSASTVPAARVEFTKWAVTSGRGHGRSSTVRTGKTYQRCPTTPVQSIRAYFAATDPKGTRVQEVWTRNGTTEAQFTDSALSTVGPYFGLRATHGLPNGLWSLKITDQGTTIGSASIRISQKSCKR